jgi:hypothetical protein
MQQHLPSDETRGIVNLVGDYVGDADVRGRLHLRLGSVGKELLGLDPTQVKPVVLLDQQKPLAQPAGSKVVTRRVRCLFVIISLMFKYPLYSSLLLHVIRFIFSPPFLTLTLVG